MKIITWNVGRPSKRKQQLISELLTEQNADIYILTETHAAVKPNLDLEFVSTITLPAIHDGYSYSPGENRTTIWTKFPVKEIHKTCDPYTCVCADIETPDGVLTVYGTIIGILGGNGIGRQRFKDDFKEQLSDFENLLASKQALIAGDFNVTFSGRPYPSVHDAQTLRSAFIKAGLINLTETIPDGIDHIVVSNSFMKDKVVSITTWNEDKKLSDHIGICISYR